MDYSVGSLADLITGSKTPNNQKVVKKQVTPLENKPQNISDGDNLSEVNLNKNENTDSDTVEKAPKKRKLFSVDENGASPKKSKNTKNAERRVAKKEKHFKNEESPDSLARTVFVGNLPITLSTKKLKKLFMNYGNIEAVRIRGVPVANPKTPKKVALIKKEFHPERKSFHGYVRFEDRESAIKATEMNGTVYKDHHLRVHLCDQNEKPDESKAIFIGNLSFYAEEDDLWQLFEPCGPVASVRIVRDGKTGIGKGFGYVNFKNSDAVTLALEMQNVQLKGRELRISLCNLGAAKKNRKGRKVKKINKPGMPKGFKKVDKEGNEGEDSNTPLKKVKSEKSKKSMKQEDDTSSLKVKNKAFQGVTFVAKKKKNKIDKGLLQKKKIIKKVAPK